MTSREQKVSHKLKIKEENPFIMPPDSDLFMNQEANRQRREEERQAHLKLPVHLKTTFCTQIRAAGKSTIKKIKSQLSNIEMMRGPLAAAQTKGYILAITKDMREDKEILADYIRKRREMFLLQYCIDVRLGEIRRLKEVAMIKEQQLEMEEKFLEDNAIMFEKFLKENDRISADAVKAADNETRAKMEKIMEIKATNAKILQFKSEINKLEERLREDLLYKKFLIVVAPEEWQEKRQQDMNSKKLLIPKSQKFSPDGRKSLKNGLDSAPKHLTESQQILKLARSDNSDIGLTIQPLVSDNSVLMELLEEEDEEYGLYFSQPQQLLDILSELEEEALNLIQHSQDTEEALEEMKQQQSTTETRM